MLPSGKTALLDFGITGRLTEAKRLALLGLVVGASNADIPAQVAALRDLGAFPGELDVQHVIDVLGLDRPPIDPTALTADELVAEMQHSIKTLLGIGARLPKELMLFVKNLMFLDGAIATLAPDLDLFAEVEAIALLFAAKHGERIVAQLGLEQAQDWAPDITGIKAGSASMPRPRASPTASSKPGGPRSATSSTGVGARPEAARPEVAVPARLAEEPDPLPAAPVDAKLQGVSTIRGLRNEDWDDWRALWGGYLAFYREELPRRPPEPRSTASAPATTGCSASWRWTTSGTASGWPTASSTPRPGPGSPSATWRTCSWTPPPGASTSGAPCSRR